MNPIKQFIEESEKKFEEKFYQENIDSEWGGSGHVDWCDKNAEGGMKSFLSSQHLALLDTVKGVIEGKKKQEANSIDVGPINIPDIETQGYNQALDDILKELTPPSKVIDN